LSRYLSLTAHAAHETVIAQALLIVMTGIVTPAVGVHQKARSRHTRPERLIKGLYDQVTVNAV